VFHLVLILPVSGDMNCSRVLSFLTCVVVTHYGFAMQLYDNEWLQAFWDGLVPPYLFLGEARAQIFYQFLIVLLLISQLCIFLYILHKVLAQIYIPHIFSPTLWVVI
jgi:hypothetical protein